MLAIDPDDRREMLDAYDLANRLFMSRFPRVGPSDTLECYGCCACQREHTEIDPEFRPHIWRQSRHGTYTRLPSPAEVLRRVAAEASR